MRTCLFFTILLLACKMSAQQSVYFPGFELINMDERPGFQYSTSKLLKSYIENNHEYTIVLDELIGQEGYQGKETLASSIAKAKSMNVPFTMKGEIHFLQGVYILSLGVYETASMQQIWHDMAKGLSEQDMDPLLSRLGRTFFTNRTAKSDVEIDEVTHYEESGVEIAQIKVNHFVGLKLAGKVMPGESTLSGFGLAYTYDASSFLFNMDFDLFPSSTLSVRSENRKWNNGSMSLGIMYPLTRKRTTPYLDGGMEYGYTKMKETFFDQEDVQSASGVGLYFGGGVILNRNSTVNLRVFTTVSIPFYRVDGRNVTGVKFGIVTSFAKKR